MKANELDALLRSAALAAAEQPLPEAPFGFAARVVALAQSNNQSSNGGADLAGLVRWITGAAVAICTLASAGAYQQFSDAEARTAPHENDYAIVDSAIRTEFSQ